MTETAPDPAGTGTWDDAGQPWPCAVAGTAMLAVPALWALASANASGAAAYRGGYSAALVLMDLIVLAVGAVAVVMTTARPDQRGVAALGVLCAALALVFTPVEPWADGLTGVAALAFLIAARLHADARRAPVDVAEWLADRRPMLVGAAITTPAAIAAALVPAAWSLPVAALVGVAAAALCTAALAT
jgi:hypothetical protein